MNPILIVLASLAQVVILSWHAPWTEGIAFGVALSAIIGTLAYTRNRWDAHLDMYLCMISWGGLGMLLPSLLTGVTCPHTFDWMQYGVMSAGMWIFSLVPIWRDARCMAQAKAEGRAWSLLLLDGLGMQLGMGMAHLPLVWVRMGDTRVDWFAHGAMLCAMGIGMMAAQRLAAEWERQDVTAMG